MGCGGLYASKARCSARRPRPLLNRAVDDFRQLPPALPASGAALLTAASPPAGTPPPRAAGRLRGARVGQSMVRKRARARRGGEPEPDRLSALPDCLLHTIMSSLKARQAVQTCVLSRRWRHLWRSVPCLDVDLDEFRTDTAAPDLDNNNAGDGSGGGDIPDPGNDSSDSDGGSSGADHDSSVSEDDTSSESDTDASDSYSWSSDSSSSDDDDYNTDKQNVWERFEDFTVNLMTHCNVAQLDSFRLHIGRDKAPRFGARQAAGWLRRAMKYCGPCPPAPLREGLSSASWLLKRLHLSYVRLDSRFAEHVSSVCRSLEDLELDSCTCKIQSITSHSLKTLVLKHSRWRDLSEITSPTLKTLVVDGGSNTDPPRQLVILAPAAAYLHLNVHVYHFRGGISINEMPSLAKTLIYLHGHRNLIVPSSSNLGGNQFKLLCGVSNVTSLELSGAGRTVLGEEPTFQEFKNLRNLVLDKCDLRDDFRTLGFFLQSSPYLEKLTLRQCQFPKYSKKKKGTPKLNKTSFADFHGLDFVCENLKVEIIYKNGDARQLRKLLLHASGNLSKNCVKLTKVK